MLCYPWAASRVKDHITVANNSHRFAVAGSLLLQEQCTNDEKKGKTKRQEEKKIAVDQRALFSSCSCSRGGHEPRQKQQLQMNPGPSVQSRVQSQSRYCGRGGQGLVFGSSLKASINFRSWDISLPFGLEDAVAVWRCGGAPSPRCRSISQRLFPFCEQARFVAAQKKGRSSGKGGMSHSRDRAPPALGDQGEGGSGPGAGRWEGASTRIEWSSHR